MAFRSCCFIIIDCLRADRLEPWGGDIPFFPGRLLKKCIVASGWTLPSIASILTGRQVSQHGLFDHRRRIQTPGVARAFREAGFFTAAVMNNNNLQPEFGFSDGFVEYHNFPNEQHDAPFALIPDILEKARPDRFLAVFHTNLVHDYHLDKPYYRDEEGAEPVPPAGNKPWMSWPPEYHDVLRNRYCRGIRFCLRRIEKELLPLLDLAETLVVVTADHGEGLYSPRVYHAGRLHNDLLQVPTVILNEHGEDSDLFSQLRLWDMIRDRLGLPQEPRDDASGVVRAEDFAYIYRHDLPQTEGRIDYKSSPGLSLQCWYDGRYKTIASRSPVDGYSLLERYDIVEDWAETNNLAVRGGEQAELRSGAAAALSAERMREHAESILDTARSHMERKAWQQCDDLLAPLRDLFLPYVPDYVRTIWHLTGLCREALADYRGAITAFEQARSAPLGDLPDPVPEVIDYHVAFCQRMLGFDGTARELFAALLPRLDAHRREDVRDLRWHAKSNLATICERQGDTAAARQWLIEALQIRPEPEGRDPATVGQRTRTAGPELPGGQSMSSGDTGTPALWAAEMAGLQAGDERLPGGIGDVNLSLNRLRLAQFLEAFAADSDMRDLLLLDDLPLKADGLITSTGLTGDVPAVALRPFRIWEYVWLFKVLGLSEGGLEVLDLGGPATHLVLLAAMAGNHVTSIDINPEIVEAGRACANALHLQHLEARCGDARRLEDIPDNHYDRIICCSVLEHLSAEDQQAAVREMARALRPGGVIGLTFDYGPPAPGANIHLPPPHEPPQDPQQIRARYLQNDLRILGNADLEPPVAGGLFHDEVVKYVIGSLFLGRPPLRHLRRPVCRKGKPSWLSALSAPEIVYGCYQEALLSRQLAHGWEELVRSRHEFEQAAAERLEALTAAHQAAFELRAQAEQREQLVKELTVALEASENRVSELEQAADERLRVLEANHRAAAEMHLEAERRAASIEELTEALRSREKEIEALRTASDG